MKKVIIALACLLSISGAKSQTVKKDANGNYVAVKATKTAGETTAKDTRKTYTDTNGKVYPVMISKNGKLFVVRISKTGKKYNQYLKL